MRLEERGLQYWRDHGYTICRLPLPIEMRFYYPNNVQILVSDAAESFDALFPLTPQQMAELDRAGVEYEIMQ